MRPDARWSCRATWSSLQSSKRGAVTNVVPVSEVPTDQMIFDIGPTSAGQLVKRLADCRTLVWNGPLGAFEVQPFNADTEKGRQGCSGIDAKRRSGLGRWLRNNDRSTCGRASRRRLLVRIYRRWCISRMAGRQEAARVGGTAYESLMLSIMRSPPKIGRLRSTSPRP